MKNVKFFSVHTHTHTQNMNAFILYIRWILMRKKVNLVWMHLLDAVTTLQFFFFNSTNIWSCIISYSISFKDKCFGLNFTFIWLPFMKKCDYKYFFMVFVDDNLLSHLLVINFLILFWKMCMNRFDLYD